MNRFFKALGMGAALSLAAFPVLAQAADVRPSDARVTVNPAAFGVVPSNVRAKANAADENGIFGFSGATTLLFFASIGISLTALIVVSNQSDPRSP